MLGLVPSSPYVVPKSFKDVIDHIGAQASLHWVIDAGDARSIASASDQTLGVLPAGGATLVRGNDATVDATRDPVHVGVIGRQSLSEYFEMDSKNGVASRRFSATTGTWWEALHKDNATFTFAGWVQFDGPMTGGQALFSDSPQVLATSIGTWVGFTTAGGVLAFETYNASGSASKTAVSTMVPSTDVPFFFAVSYNETAGTGFFQINGTQETISGGYTSPSASASTLGVPLLYAGGKTAANETNRLFNEAFWTRSITQAEGLALFASTRAKFGI
jgi:hypothetical protein